VSTVTDPTAAPPPAPQMRPRETIADLLHRLGDVPADRVRADPPPGTATLQDLIASNDAKDRPICEWVDGTLVEKAIGAFESWVAILIAGQFDRYLEQNDLGMLYGEAAVLRILPGIGRAPDVTFVSWASLPGGKPPPRSDRVPEVVPDLAVEVLSASNTAREMDRKRREYIQAGVKLVWEIDPQTRAATVYTAADQATPVPIDGTLDGGAVLPGFRLSLKAVFDRAERAGGGRNAAGPPAPRNEASGAGGPGVVVRSVGAGQARGVMALRAAFSFRSSARRRCSHGFS
jgi:Uma2 family endonuclease